MFGYVQGLPYDRAVLRGIFEKRYDLSERDAGTDASYLLAGSAFLYPIVSDASYSG